MPLFTKPNLQTRWASFENPTIGKGKAGAANHGAKGMAFDRLFAGDEVVLLNYSGGSGTITRMWFTINDRSPEMLRALRLRIWWDDAADAAVDAPFGDFFCNANGNATFENELFASPEGRSFLCYVPMPFRKSARVTLYNGSNKDLIHLFYDINLTVGEIPNDALYFHASWRRQQCVPLESDFEILPKISGEGRFIGTYMMVNANPVYGDQWWGEGEVKVYLDGDVELPTLCGTGTEDYLGTGWEQGHFANRYQGCTTADKDARIWGFYRLHIPDPIYFERDIRVTIQDIGGADVEKVRALMDTGAPLVPVSCDDSQHMSFKELYRSGQPLPQEGWINYYRSDDFSAVAWYYLDKP